MNASPGEPTEIGPYRVVERIGEGGMGVVHLALSPEGALVAVKTLRPWIVGGHDGRLRFEREVATLRRVRGARIAEVIDADVVVDPPYVVTRYVRGPALSKVVADHGPLRAEALDRLALGLLEALASVHAVGIVHRDVKPANVLLADRGPVLIDFGLAHAVDETRLTAVGFVAGTPGYLAPETVLGEPATSATDVHGWAATLAFAALGEPPYGSGPDSVVLDRIRRGDHVPILLDTPLGQVLRDALTADPLKRPGIAELAAALGADPVAFSTQAAAAVTVDAVSTDETPTVHGAASADDTPTAIAAVVPAGAGAATDTVVFDRSTAPTMIERRDPPVPPPPVAGLARPQPQAQPPRTTPPRSAVPGAPPIHHPQAGEGAPLRSWHARLMVTIGALALLFLIGLAPYVAAGVLLVLLVLGRVTWRVRRRLYERRVARGSHGRDLLRASLPAPADAVVSFLPALGQGVLAMGCGVLVGAAVDLTGLGDIVLGERLPYLVGGVLALALAWWGPGAGRFRHGIRVLVAPTERRPRAAWVVGGVFAIAAWTFVLLWEAFGTSWWPGQGPPNPFG